MECLYCKNTLKKGVTTYTINRNGYHLTIDNLNAYVCSQCGETLLDEKAVESIQQIIIELDNRLKNLQKIGELKFVWGPNWAKTEKQKKRYKEFQGEDMIFFTGEIDEFVNVKNSNEDSWNGEKLIKISDAVKFIESESFDEHNKKYREFQLSSLKNLLTGDKND